MFIHLRLQKVDVANGKFQLLSFQEGSRKVYHVSYGDDLNMPSCTCYSWLDSAYLCKHFFAIMEKYPEWSWLQLSSLYRNSPFLKLDLRENELSFYNPPTSNDESDQKLDEEVLAEEDRITEENNENPEYFKYSGDTCRRELKDITELSFCLDDQLDHLHYLYKQLLLLKNNIRNLIPKESGILLRTTTQKEDSWFKRTDKKMFGTLPFKKKKTNSLAKRVGIKKETLVRASNINITAKNSKDVKKITEDIVFDDLIVEECGSGNEIYANDFPSLHITQSELKSLSNNEMISDVVINVAQKMMAKWHPCLKGLQDPILGQTMSFRRFQ